MRGSGRIDAIRLMKLWRERKAVPFKKSFLLEMLTIEACSGMRKDEIAPQVVAALGYVRDKILTCNIVDPANSNNSLCDDLTYSEKERIRQAAQEALRGTWAEVFN